MQDGKENILQNNILTRSQKCNIPRTSLEMVNSSFSGICNYVKIEINLLTTIAFDNRIQYMSIRELTWRYMASIPRYRADIISIL